MARTPEQIVQLMLGQYAVQVATLQAQLEAAQERIKILEEDQAKPEPPKQ